MSISEAESIVIEVLWENGPSTADDVINAVADEQNWSAATVKSLLNRLLNKDAVKAEKDGRKYIYSAALARADYVAQQSESLVDRLFDGRITPLVSHFSKQKKLKKSDIEELKQLIEELDDDR